MLDVTSVLTFSHHYCVAICAVLVPMNLLTTLLTIVLTAVAGVNRQPWFAAGIASLCSGIMVLHVLTWFVVGVIAVPTFVLLTLGSVCLGMNLWAVLHPASLLSVLLGLKDWAVDLWTTSRKRFVADLSQP